MSTEKIIFSLPPKGLFKKANDEDPLPYYYKPIIGKMYINRIQYGLNLLENRHYNTIMDFGYGNGLLLPTLCKISSDVSGVDLCTDIEDVSKPLTQLNLKVKLYKDDISKIGFENESYDLIVCFSVFEHIKDFTIVLKELHRIIKKDGLLLIGMPRVDNFMSVFFNIIGFRGIEKHHVTNHRQILKGIKSYFELIRTSQYPINSKNLPALYYNLLFKKI